MSKFHLTKNFWEKLGQFLPTIETYKIITAKVFSGTLGTHWNLRNHNDFRVPFTRTVYFGIEIISHLRPKIWDIVLTELKQNQADLKNQ